MIFGRFKEDFLSSKKPVQKSNKDKSREKKHLYIWKQSEGRKKQLRKPTWTFETIAFSLFFGVATTRLTSIASQNFDGAFASLHTTLATFGAFGPLGKVGPLTIYWSTYKDLS